MEAPASTKESICLFSSCPSRRMPGYPSGQAWHPVRCTHISFPDPLIVSPVPPHSRTYPLPPDTGPGLDISCSMPLSSQSYLIRPRWSCQSLLQPRRYQQNHAIPPVLFTSNPLTMEGSRLSSLVFPCDYYSMWLQKRNLNHKKAPAIPDRCPLTLPFLKHKNWNLYPPVIVSQSISATPLPSLTQRKSLSLGSTHK